MRINAEIRGALALAGALVAGACFAATCSGGTGQTYQMVDCVPCQQVVQQTQYQTVTINEPRVKWTPTIEYVEREIQVPVQTLSLPCIDVAAVNTSSVPPQPVPVQNVVTQNCVPCQQVQCPGGQCYQSYAVADSDIGTNMRYEPAVLTLEDGSQKIMRTPIRTALAARRMAKGDHTPDPPAVFRVVPRNP